MSEAIVRQLMPVYGFLERNFRLLQRYWAWELVWFLYTLAITLSIGFLAVGMEMVSGVKVPQNRVLVFLLTGSLVWRYLSQIFWETSNVISWERWEGTIEYTFMAPISRVTQLLAMSVYGTVYAGVIFVAMLAICAAIFHIDLSAANLLGALLILAASTLSRVALGEMRACLTLMSPETGTQMTGIIEAVLLMISGIYYPIEVLPGWLQYVAKVSPITYTLKGMRACLIDGIGMAEVWAYVWPLLIVGALLVPAGIKVFAIAERYCKRKGTLKRSG